ncbi:hypothetical protein [Nocardia sp. NPDC059691]|uniref:hypothetical protein n=1 Tax=Nocardia sp. NPDC059691 TaxID=3346908 RepID=UPI0036C6AEE8
MITVDRATGLPTGWSVRIKPACDLQTVTLIDAEGIVRQWTVRRGADSHRGGEEITVRRLADITDPVFRECARELVDRHRDHLITAAQTFEAFCRTVGDLDHLTQHLESTIPGLGTRIQIDHTTLSVVATLTATGQATGAVCSLVTTWLADTGHGGQLPSGVTMDLQHNDLTLTVTFDQARAEAFFTWYSTHTAALPVDPTIAEEVPAIVD